MRAACVAALSVPAAATAFAVLAPGAPAATAAAPFPGSSRSHYLTSTDERVLRDAARRDAGDALRAGLREALVVLDAGQPVESDGTVLLPDRGGRATPGHVR